MLNRVVDEECRTDNHCKPEGGSVCKKQQIRNPFALHSPPAAHSCLHRASWNRGAGDQTVVNLLEGGLPLGNPKPDFGFGAPALSEFITRANFRVCSILNSLKLFRGGHFDLWSLRIAPIVLDSLPFDFLASGNVCTVAHLGAYCLLQFPSRTPHSYPQLCSKLGAARSLPGTVV